MIKKLKSIKYMDLEDMVYRFYLAYNEIVDSSALLYFGPNIVGYTIAAAIL